MLLPSYSRGRLGARSLVIEVQSPDVSSQVGVVTGPGWRGPGQTPAGQSCTDVLVEGVSLQALSHVLRCWGVVGRQNRATILLIIGFEGPSPSSRWCALAG